MVFSDAFFCVYLLYLHLKSFQDHRYTPLHLAVLYDHLEMVQYLIKEGVNANVKDEVSAST